MGGYSLKGQSLAALRRPLYSFARSMCALNSALAGVAMVLSGCASSTSATLPLIEECRTFDPSSTWELASKPGRTIESKFVEKPWRVSRLWFKDATGRYAACDDCGGMSRHAGSFEIVDPADSEGSIIIITNCGPY